MTTPDIRNVTIETTFVYPTGTSPILYTLHNVPVDKIAEWNEDRVVTYTDAGGATFVYPYENILRLTIAAPPHITTGNGLR